MVFGPITRVLTVVLALVLGCAGCGKKPAPAPGANAASEMQFVPGSLFAQAEQLRDACKFDEAGTMFKCGLSEPDGPFHAQASRQMGLMYVDLQNVGKAIEGFRGAWTKAPEGAAKDDAHAKFLQLIAFDRYRSNTTGPGDDPAKQLEIARTTAQWLAGERFVLNGSEVRDTSTNLIWQRCLVGQTMQDGIECEGNQSPPAARSITSTSCTRDHRPMPFARTLRTWSRPSGWYAARAKPTAPRLPSGR
jgi:hypothetical protein